MSVAFLPRGPPSACRSSSSRTALTPHVAARPSSSELLSAALGAARRTTVSRSRGGRRAAGADAIVSLDSPSPTNPAAALLLLALQRSCCSCCCCRLWRERRGQAGCCSVVGRGRGIGSGRSWFEFCGRAAYATATSQPGGRDRSQSLQQGREAGRRLPCSCSRAVLLASPAAERLRCRRRSCCCCCCCCCCCRCCCCCCCCCCLAGRQARRAAGRTPEKPIVPSSCWRCGAAGGLPRLLPLESQRRGGDAAQRGDSARQPAVATLLWSRSSPLLLQ